MSATNHPGVIFRRKYLKQRGDLLQFATGTKISRQYWGDVFRGEKRVTAKLACHMANTSIESAEHWASLADQ